MSNVTLENLRSELAPIRAQHDELPAINRALTMLRQQCFLLGRPLMISPTPISLRERSKPSTPPRPASGVATAAEPTQNIFKRADDQGYPNCSPLRAHCDGIRKCDGCNTSQSHNGISIALVLSLALLGASPAAAGTRILVSYTWVETEVCHTNRRIEKAISFPFS
jgi:hypothetical protein